MAGRNNGACSPRSRYNLARRRSHWEKQIMRRSMVASGALTVTLSILAPAFPQREEAVATVRVDSGHVIHAFDPDDALGSSIDVLSHSEIDKVYSPHIIAESLSAG